MGGVLIGTGGGGETPSLVSFPLLDRVNKKVMKDPRIALMMEGQAMPPDANRAAHAGFEVAVDA